MVQHMIWASKYYSIKLHTAGADRKGRFYGFLKDFQLLSGPNDY